MEFGAILLGLFTGICIKILVMILAGQMVYRLYRSLHPTSADKLWILCGSLLFFLAEMFCAIEAFVVQQSSDSLSFLHSIASALAMGAMGWGFLLSIDKQFLHFFDHSKSCVAHTHCEICTKRQMGVCRYRPVYSWSAPLLIMMMIPLFWVSTQPLVGNPNPYVLPFPSLNHWYDLTWVPFLKSIFPGIMTSVTEFEISSVVLRLEFQWLPWAAILVGSAGWVLLFFRGRESRGVGVLVFAFGIAGYAFFEALVYGMTRDPVLGSFFHEGGELLFLLMARPFIFPKRRLWQQPS